MSENAVIEERLNTHIIDSNTRYKNHDERLVPLEDFMKEIKIDLAWVKKIGVGILGVVVSPYAVELFKYLLKKG